MRVECCRLFMSSSRYIASGNRTPQSFSGTVVDFICNGIGLLLAVNGRPCKTPTPRMNTRLRGDCEYPELPVCFPIAAVFWEFCRDVCLPRHRRFLSLAHRPHDRSVPSAGRAGLTHALAADRGIGGPPVHAQGTQRASHARSGPLWRGTSACGSRIQRRASPRATAGDDLPAVPQARLRRI